MEGTYLYQSCAPSHEGQDWHKIKSTAMTPPSEGWEVDDEGEAPAPRSAAIVELEVFDPPVKISAEHPGVLNGVFSIQILFEIKDPLRKTKKLMELSDRGTIEITWQLIMPATYRANHLLCITHNPVIIKTELPMRLSETSSEKLLCLLRITTAKYIR